MKYLSKAVASDKPAASHQIIRENNLKAIFDLIRSGRCTSRAELVRATKLSATTVSTLVEELQALDLLWVGGPMLASVPGRPPMALSINELGRQIPVFSLSRRGVQYVLYDLDCRALESLFVDFPVPDELLPDFGDQYAGLFEDILLNRSKRFERERAIVIGITFPGVYLEDERAFSVRTAMNVSLSEASMRGLEERLATPLFFANASMCRAYAEKKCLDRKSGGEALQDLIYINICDGVGSGIISGGAMLTGPTNTAGEIGHITIDYRGRACRCGSNGCLEQYVSQSAIVGRVAEACRRAKIGEPDSLEAVAALQAEGLPGVAKALDAVAEILSCGIYAAMCLSGIRRVVVGGGIERLGEPFLKRLLSHVRGQRSLAKDVLLTYPLSGPDGDTTGIVHYFLDKAYTIV